MSYSFFLTIRLPAAKVGICTPLDRTQLASFAIKLCGHGCNPQLAHYKSSLAYNNMLAGMWAHRADPGARMPTARAHLAVIRTWPGAVESDAPLAICEFCGK